MKKILVIEDDTQTGSVYRTRLEREGYEAEVAGDGEAGYYRIQELKPHAVLLDLMLPKLNGVELLKRIRKHLEYSTLPIIVFTNAYVPNMIQEAYSAGANAVFNKATLTPRLLIDTLHDLTNGGSAKASAKPDAPTLPPVNSEAGPPMLPLPHNPPPTTYAASSRFSSAAMSAISAASSILSPRSAPPLASPEANESNDQQFQADLIQLITKTGPEILAQTRKHLQEFSKAATDDQRLPALLEMYRKVHSVTGSAGAAGLHRVSQLTAALEALLKELHERPKNINPSSLRTVATAIDVVGDLLHCELDGPTQVPGDYRIMVVDDEVLSRRAILYALEKAGLSGASVEDPQAALQLAGQQHYDLILLDIQMPVMNGYDLCSKIHAQVYNQDTPVVFVTSLNDFPSRARSNLCGGADLIGKPFMFIELSVKALTHLLQRRSVAAPAERQAA